MPGRGLIIDVPQIEGGTMVLAEAPNADRLDILPVVRWDGERSLIKAYDEVLVPNSGNWDWIALDSITAAQELAKRKITRERGGASDSTITGNPHKVTLPEHGEIGEMMKDLAYKLRLLNKVHVIVTAQQRSRQDDEGSVLQPDISPSALTGWLPSMFLVGHLSVIEVAVNEEATKFEWERRLRVGAHPNFVTKARALPSRPLPAIIRKPHLGEIFSWCLGKDGAKAPTGLSEAAATARPAGEGEPM